MLFSNVPYLSNFPDHLVLIAHDCTSASLKPLRKNGSNYLHCCKSQKGGLTVLFVILWCVNTSDKKYEDMQFFILNFLPHKNSRCQQLNILPYLRSVCWTFWITFFCCSTNFFFPALNHQCKCGRFSKTSVFCQPFILWPSRTYKSIITYHIKV